jgi:hypothetical protein
VVTLTKETRLVINDFNSFCSAMEQIALKGVDGFDEAVGLVGQDPSLGMLAMWIALQRDESDAHPISAADVVRVRALLYEMGVIAPILTAHQRKVNAKWESVLKRPDLRNDQRALVLALREAKGKPVSWDGVVELLYFVDQLSAKFRHAGLEFFCSHDKRTCWVKE